MDSTANLCAQLTATARRHLGDTTLEVIEARALSAGASADTTLVTVTRSGVSEHWILRRLMGNDDIATSVSKETEALTQIACRRHGVPVPEILFILDDSDALGRGYAMREVKGETLPNRILKNPEFAQARTRMAAQCGEILARIHAVPIRELPALKNESTEQQIDVLYRLYASFNEPQPVFELAFRWLRANIPTATRNTLVHGDFRNGNLMVDDNGIAAALDWELTHLGDPMEDLGWVCVNSWRFGQRDKPVGGFGDRADLFASYEQHSGVRVDATAVHYWEVFGTLKWGIICQVQAFAHLSGAIRSHERAMIGRRVSETTIDLLALLGGETDWPTPTAAGLRNSLIYDRPESREILAALQDFTGGTLLDETRGALQFKVRVLHNALRILAREQDAGAGPTECAIQRLQGLLSSDDTDYRALNAALCKHIRDGHRATDDGTLMTHLRQLVIDQLAVDNPAYSTFRQLSRGG